ncbi:MAG: hypothetical protein CSA33_02650 [Desulfobulbus propionicus]|nr:MAG: hypothetical protein CSA33_02650 [Desulfobulbus propionicus]
MRERVLHAGYLDFTTEVLCHHEMRERYTFLIHPSFFKYVDVCCTRSRCLISSSGARFGFFWQLIIPGYMCSQKAADVGIAWAEGWWTVWRNLSLLTDNASICFYRFFSNKRNVDEKSGAGVFVLVGACMALLYDIGCSCIIFKKNDCRVRS